jgi:hypothetical protein
MEQEATGLVSDSIVDGHAAALSPCEVSQAELKRAHARPIAG